MGDINQTITLSAVGGDASAAEIQKTSMALENVSNTSSSMEKQFSHRFQHIGLMLFAGDALRASGLGAETRQVITGLNAALIAGESSFGAAAGPVFLFIAALTALVGIAIKVSDHHKTLIDTLEKEAKAINDALAPHEKIIEALQRYEKAGHELTDQQKSLLLAEQALSADMKQNLTEAYQKQLTEIEKQIMANIAHAQTMHNVNAVGREMKTIWDAVLEAFKAVFQALSYLIPGWTNLSHGITSAVAAMDKYKASVHLTASESAELTKKNDALRAKYQEIIDQINHLGKTTEDYYTEAAKKSEESSKKQYEVAKHTIDQIGADMGNAFAKMIVEGENFTQAMQRAFTNMAEQIISKIIQMIIEWEIFTMLTGMGGPLGAIGAVGLKGMGMAEGGTAVVTGPTLFLAGEAGPEVASFTPLGRSGGNTGSGGGGGGGNIGTVQITLNVDHIEGDSPAKTLDMLSQEIRRQSVSGRIFATTVVGIASQTPNQAF